ncbi:MAG: riboflavin synthase [Acidobacteriaceae bacterium]|nr:riboflavin synthase [Acidobacteriaceae bacterium]
MFTGIIEELGRVVALQLQTTGARLTIACSEILQDASPGASIAVNGACLTAVELGEGRFAADLAPETLGRTNLGALQPGALVNLERPLRANSRLDGHFVLGHVDGTAEVLSLASLGGNNWWLRLRVEDELLPYIAPKGSLAVDGISLTVAEIAESIVGFTVIPHTYTHTAVHGYEPGTRVNIEIDILAKHLERLIAAGRRNPK